MLARFWTVPGRPKIDKKSKKSRLGRFWNAFRIFYRFWNGFGKVWGRFWKGFGRGSEGFFRFFHCFWNGFGKVLGGFGEVLGRVSAGFLRFFRSWRNQFEVFRVAGLALMISATRGRSMEKY